MRLTKLLSLCTLLALGSAAYIRDNALRPSPASAPTCLPSPVIDADTRDGDFDHSLITAQPGLNIHPPTQAVLGSQPSWYFNSEKNASGAFRTVPAGPNGVGNTTAGFLLIGQKPNVLPGAVIRLSQQITYCSGTTYEFSLYARQLYSLDSQYCRLAFFTQFEGTVARFQTPAFTGEFQKFGPVTMKPDRDNGVRNDKGEWEDRLDLLVQCTGIAGKRVVYTLFEIEHVRVEPVPE
ncbi:MAG: hypothetical protein Q9168_005820 [Polycauliona sp. 1 TL-2023]